MPERSRRSAVLLNVDHDASTRPMLLTRSRRRERCKAEPTLGPVQTLEIYDPLVAKIEAVLEHRRALVSARTLMLAHVGDQIAKLPTEIRDQLTTTGKIEGRLRRLDALDPDIDSTPAGAYRLVWLLDFIDQDKASRREIRCLERLIDELLDEHGTTLREEPGIGPIAAATLVCEVGNPFRFCRESKFAKWCGTGAVALSSGEGSGKPVKHRLDFRGNRRINSVLYIASVTQQRHQADAQTYLARKTAEGKTRREARRAHKRHLANRVIRRMWRDQKEKSASQQPHRLTRERPTPPHGHEPSPVCFGRTGQPPHLWPFRAVRQKRPRVLVRRRLVRRRVHRRSPQP